MQHFPLTERLHTDILEEKYGAIHTKVFKHTSTVREALLVDRKGIARTYALTLFEGTMNRSVRVIDEDIRKGKPIGKAFRAKGYAIRKNVVDVFIVPLPDWLRKEFRTEEGTAKARLSEFYAKKRGVPPIVYGTVTEVYSPDFRRPAINEADKVQVSPTTSCLEEEGFTASEIYRRIGDDNDYDDIPGPYAAAKRNSKAIVARLRKRVRQEIARHP
jgi:hypothetical protein